MSQEVYNVNKRNLEVCDTPEKGGSNTAVMVKKVSFRIAEDTVANGKEPCSRYNNYSSDENLISNPTEFSEIKERGFTKVGSVFFICYFSTKLYNDHAPSPKPETSSTKRDTQ